MPLLSVSSEKIVNSNTYFLSAYVDIFYDPYQSPPSLQRSMEASQNLDQKNRETCTILEAGRPATYLNIIQKLNFNHL